MWLVLEEVGHFQKNSFSRGIPPAPLKNELSLKRKQQQNTSIFDSKHESRQSYDIESVFRHHNCLVFPCQNITAIVLKIPAIWKHLIAKQDKTWINEGYDIESFRALQLSRLSILNYHKQFEGIFLLKNLIDLKQIYSDQCSNSKQLRKRHCYKIAFATK